MIGVFGQFLLFWIFFGENHPDAHPVKHPGAILYDSQKHVLEPSVVFVLCLHMISAVCCFVWQPPSSWSVLFRHPVAPAIILASSWPKNSCLAPSWYHPASSLLAWAESSKCVIFEKIARPAKSHPVGTGWPILLFKDRPERRLRDIAKRFLTP